MKPFEPRSRSKRTRFLASIRITDEEKEVIDWLATRLAEKDGRSYSSADVVRAALALLFDAERTASAPGSAPSLPPQRIS